MAQGKTFFGIHQNHSERVHEAFAAVYSYSGKDQDGKDETKAEFFERMMKLHIANVVKSYEVNKAAEEARAKATAAVDKELLA